MLMLNSLVVLTKLSFQGTPEPALYAGAALTPYQQGYSTTNTDKFISIFQETCNWYITFKDKITNQATFSGRLKQIIYFTTVRFSRHFLRCTNNLRSKLSPLLSQYFTDRLELYTHIRILETT